MASRGVNKCILVGNVGGEVELKYLPSGGAVANVTLATSQEWKDKNTGEQKSAVEWHRIVFFNRLAEIVGEYVKKGSKIYVEGSLRTRSWEQDGIKRYATEIVAAEMQLLDSRGSSGGGDEGSVGSHPQESQARKAPAARHAGNGTEASPYAGQSGFDNFTDDSEIPF